MHQLQIRVVAAEMWRICFQRILAQRDSKFGIHLTQVIDIFILLELTTHEDPFDLMTFLRLFHLSKYCIGMFITV